MLEQEKQQLTIECPTEPVDKPHAWPVDKLRVHHKHKTISDATCQTADSVISVVDDINLPIVQRKGVGHVLTISYLILFPMSTFHHHIVPLCLICLFQWLVALSSSSGSLHLMSLLPMGFSLGYGRAEPGLSVQDTSLGSGIHGELVPATAV
jgi:hypothetical protein